MSKKDYRIRNWKDYNQALVKRGSVTFWFSEDSLASWEATLPSNKRGRPFKYSDHAIICALTIKSIYKLSFRATEGFLGSLIDMLKLTTAIPDYTLLCKRQSKLEITLRSNRSHPGENLNIVVDSTGLKIFGEGEWKVRQHGFVKKRLWRKLHLAVNSDSQEIESFELTDLGMQDCQVFPKIIEKIKEPIGQTIGDGAYDRFSCYEVAQKKEFEFIAPPQHNSRTSKERPRNKKKASAGAVEKRDQVIEEVRQLGLAEWKKTVGYHKRSLAETAMFRVKTLMGNRLKSKLLAHQKIEVSIWCLAINKMSKLGMPSHLY